MDFGRINPSPQSYPSHGGTPKKEEQDGEKGTLRKVMDGIKDFYEDKIVGGWEATDYRVKGSSIGVIVGATTGYIAGLQEDAHNVTVTKTYGVPLTKDINLGKVPNDWYQDDRGSFDHGPDKHDLQYAPKGWVEIHRDDPILDQRGKPVLIDKTETLHSQKFSSLATTLMGVGIGATAGFLASIAIKILAELRNS